MADYSDSKRDYDTIESYREANKTLQRQLANTIAANKMLGDQVPRRYRKKPAIVSAYRVYTPHDIETLEGTMRANPGDWIITGVKGEQYPCKNTIFRLTYDFVEDEEIVVIKRGD